MVSYHYIRGVQPFAIAGCTTFFYCQVRTNTEYIQT